MKCPWCKVFRTIQQVCTISKFYKRGKFPRLQILTIEDLLNGKKPETPPPYRPKAGRIRKQGGRQGELGL
ncbi:MAG: hypothetical protein ACOYYJ_17395 [Chloroflexota bacterium]